jgi:tRNA A-37 threonylcarbamoyl transferase component Bud32
MSSAHGTSESSAHGTSEGYTPTVSGYEILRLLGQGGMGKVYLAQQQALKRLVCVKVLSIPEGEDANLCRAMFVREAELLASVSHPHILSVFDFGTTADSNLPFLVTEYIEEGDLRRRMSKGQAMPIDRVRSILTQVGQALEFLHGRGIIHRDLKPENILMPTDAQCKVGDFGLAVMQDKAGLLTRSMRGLGTPGYVSPEQQYGLKIDERTDQYSLAALGYELLTGRHPLGQFLPPSRHNLQLPRELDPVILRGLAEEPRDRYPSVRAFLTAFEQSLASSPRKGISGSLAVMGLLVLLLVVASAAAFVTFGPGKEAPGVGQNRQAPELADQTGAHPGQPPAVQKPAGAEPGPGPAPRSPEFTRLTELRAYRIWVEAGRPQGKEGEAVKEKNWVEAEKQVDAEVEARAFQFWVQQGRPVGPKGEAASKKNRHDAEVQLLEETEAEFRRVPIH